jgi:hypothetical protein
VVGAPTSGFSLPMAAVRMPLVEAADDVAVLRVPGVAEYLVRSDGSVETAPAAGATDLDVACFREGPVAALGFLLQGSFPLRATAVATDTGGVVLCGPSAAGKSATAAALALRGNPVLAGKVAVITDGALTVSGTPAHVALWPPIAQALALDTAQGRMVRPALAKRAYCLGPAPAREAVAASLVVLLEVDNRLRRPELHEVTDGRQKLQALIAAQWHRRLIAPLRLGIAHLDWAASLAATVRVVRLRRPRHEMTIHEVAGLIETTRRRGVVEGER